MTSTKISFLNHAMPTPLVLASGIWGTTTSLMERAARAGCGAVTAKSCGPVPRAGHVNPSCVAWEHGLINAIGLANPGAEAEVELLAATKQALAAVGRAAHRQHLRRDAGRVRHGGRHCRRGLSPTWSRSTSPAPMWAASSANRLPPILRMRQT